ncbi:MAG TPA: hypothetical protein VFG11_03950, partial [Acidobacteriota bacterium]|nr:hypothetical protein [Acidobacteriota bacterium]
MPSRLLSAACVLALCLIAATLPAQESHDHRLFVCAENGLETGSTGCQLLGKKNITQFGAGPLYWHLNKLTKEMPMSFDAGEYGLIVKDKNDVWL